MKRAFSLVELMIVVAILGILAAITLPLFQSNATEAKEAAAKDNLRILRNAIEIYAAQHSGVPPGYVHDQPPQVTGNMQFNRAMVINGHYLSALPTNPFNNKSSVKLLGDQEQFPAEATGTYGWIYQPRTKIVKVDWPGTDSKGIRYFDY